MIELKTLIDEAKTIGSAIAGALTVRTWIEIAVGFIVVAAIIIGFNVVEQRGIDWAHSPEGNKIGLKVMPPQ